MPLTSKFSALDRQFARLMQTLAEKPSPELEMAAQLVSFYREQGHTCFSLKNVNATSHFLESFPEGFSAPPLEKWINQLRTSSVVGAPGDFKPLILDANHRLYLRRYWEYEAQLAHDILERAQGLAPNVDFPLLEKGLRRLFPEESGEMNWQKLAAFTAVVKKFCVISGGPGTGKTRAIVLILALLIEQANGRKLRIHLCAPTGKAAARLKESIQNTKGKIGLAAEIENSIPTDATTIHRLLGAIPDSPYFRHDHKTPLAADVVIVDEASMVDLALMAKLFAAIPHSTRLILLGDKDQLSSVEAGAVLGDICNNGQPIEPANDLLSLYRQVAVQRLDKITPPAAASGLEDNLVELKENYRFGSQSGIYKFSRLLNEGDAESALSLLKNSAQEDLAWKPLPRASELSHRLEEPIIQGFAAYLKCETPEEALATFNQFRILCALRQGPYGVAQLNEAVENILLEAGLIQKENRWYRGRPIMVTRNDYNLKLFNGDIGIILPGRENDLEMRAYFVSSDGKLRQFLPSRLPTHETVYAMTVHKSQGSEFQKVLMILPDRENPILTRELLYTGVTRARERVELWLKDSVARKAISTRIERNSGLRDALWAKI